jgi:hypothetical protein
MENPDQVVTLKASKELLDQLQDWSDPVEIRIRPTGFTPTADHEMEVRIFPEKHDDRTLAKVQKAIMDSGYYLSDWDALQIIAVMQNAGILFRERA